MCILFTVTIGLHVHVDLEFIAYRLLFLWSREGWKKCSLMCRLLFFYIPQCLSVMMSFIILYEKLQSIKPCTAFLLEKRLIWPARQCTVRDVQMIRAPLFNPSLLWWHFITNILRGISTFYRAWTFQTRRFLLILIAYSV